MLKVAVAAGVVIALGAGCSTDPMQSIPLPGRIGVQSDAYIVTIKMAEVANLVPNSEVKVDDVTVGTVTSIAFDDWAASLTVSLKPDVELPANAVARIGQKSLLGAEYLEMAAPTAETPVGTLRGGDVIPVEHTDRYPETEEVLAALSTVLNGGGLQQIRTISTELDAALAGREGDVRAFIGNLKTFAGALDEQKQNIVSAIDGFDKLAATLAGGNDTIQRALDHIPDGLAALEADRQQLVDGLDALSKLGDVATRFVSGSQDDLVANLRDLQPALQRLADSGKDLTQSISVAGTFPFPSHTSFPSVVRGDFGNLFITVDLDPLTLARNFGFGFTDAGGLQVPLLGSLPPLGAGITGGDPLTLPSNLPVPGGVPVPLLPDQQLGPVQPELSATPTSTPSPTPDNGGGLLGGLLRGGSR